MRQALLDAERTSSVYNTEIVWTPGALQQYSLQCDELVDWRGHLSKSTSVYCMWLLKLRKSQGNGIFLNMFDSLNVSCLNSLK